jgi:predicted AAA+ superfamily ATPase
MVKPPYRILKGEQSSMKDEPKVARTEDIFIYEPFNMLVSGIANCGKTHFILRLLEKQYHNRLNFIVIFCLIYFFNVTYERKWIFKNKSVIIINHESVKNNLDAVLKVTE